MMRVGQKLIAFAPFLVAATLPHSKPAAAPPVMVGQGADVAPERTQAVAMQFESKRRAYRYEIVKGVILVPVQIAGKDAWALLSNMSTASVIDTNFARQTGLALGDKLPPIIMQGRTLESRNAPDVTVALPGQLRFTASFAAADLSVLSEPLGRPLALVIGREYFSNLQFFFQSSPRVLNIGASGAARWPTDASYVPLEDDGTTVLIEANGVALRARIDLGFSGGFATTPELWSKLGIEGPPVSQQKVMNARGKQTVDINVLPRLKVGPVEAFDVETRRIALPARGPDAIVGVGVLSRYDFSLDQKARRLWFPGIRPSTTRK